MGWRSSDTRELILEDVFVPDDQVLGEPGKGFTNFMQTLDAGRIGIAALSLGIAEGAYEEAMKYANERRQFNQRINEFQGIQFMLADMATEIEAAKHLVFHAAWLKQEGARSARKRRWRSCSRRSWQCGQPPGRCRSTGATATPRSIRWSE